MKIIDIHTHYWDKDITEDPDKDKYLAGMDENGVQAALLLGVSYGVNEHMARVIKKHSGRFFGGGYIDLREPVRACIELLKTYAGCGFKFIKMFPNIGFDPNDEKYEPFWQAAEDNKLSCLSHCGWVLPVMFPQQEKETRRISGLTATPFHFEVPARRHPGINFVFAHFGGGATYLETVVLISRMKNAYADVAPGWGKWVFEQKMPGLKGLDFSHVLYATDNCDYDVEWWKDTLKSMGRSDEDIENFFYNNAARLLGIKTAQKPGTVSQPARKPSRR